MKEQSDWISLLPDMDSLHDTRVMQLSVDQLHVKDAWLLHTQTLTYELHVINARFNATRHCKPAHTTRRANIPYGDLA